jgi:hypothetical protein
MKIAGIAAAAIAVLIGTPTLAADMPAKAPLAVPVWNWTGIYFGLNLGSAQETDPVLFTDFNTAITNHPGGGIFGGQAGLDYQFRSLVVGVRGDGDSFDRTASSICPNPTALCNSNPKSITDVVGRIGFAWNNFLAYGVAGGAWLRDNFTVTAGGVVAERSAFSASGSVFGVGAEWAFRPVSPFAVSLFIEYDSYRFGTVNTSTFDPTSGVLEENISIKPTDNVIKGGLNVRFDWPQFGNGAPIATRY